MSDKVGIMICRHGDRPLRPGYRLGPKCEMCGRGLQLSPEGFERMATLYALCEPCGMTMYKRLQDNGTRIDEQLSAGAVQQVVEFVQQEIRKKAANN